MRIVRSLVDLAGAGRGRRVDRARRRAAAGRRADRAAGADQRGDRGRRRSSCRSTTTRASPRAMSSTAADADAGRAAARAGVRDGPPRPAHDPRRIEQLLGMIDPMVRPATAGDVGPLAVLEAEARAALVDARGGAALARGAPADRRVVGRRRSPTARRVRRRARRRRRPPARRRLPRARRRRPAGPRRSGLRHAGRPRARLRRRPARGGDGGGASPPAPRVLEGHALPGDRETKNLYERAGITARLITVSRRLD